MKRQLYMGGGIMDVVPRDRALLGGIKKAVKKVTKGVKDIVSSDIGKAALIGAAAFGIPGTSIGGIFGRSSFMVPAGGAPGIFGLGGVKNLFAAGASKDLATKEAAKQLSVGKTLGIMAGGSLLGALAAGVEAGDEEAIEASRNVDALKTYLRQGYRNLKSFVNEDGCENSEALEAQVNRDVSEYTSGQGGYAEGGRIGFAEGPVLPPDPTQPVNPFGPKPPADAPVLPDRKMASAPDPAAERNDMLEEMSLKYYKKPLKDITPDQFLDLEEALDDMGSLDKEEDKGLMANMDIIALEFMQKFGYDIMLATPDVRENFIQEWKDKNFYNKSEAPTEKRGLAAIGGKMDTASDNAMQAAGIEGLPIRQNPRGVKELDLRETGGFIQPVGIKEKQDDIPAMLSNNEFVFTADAVRGAGDGDVNLGAKRMYDTMKKLEAGGRA